MKLDLGNYRCAIFDLDGTLLDSTWVWEKIDIDFLAKRGIAVPGDYMQEIRNHNFITGSKYVIERFHLNENAEVTTASGTTSNKNTVYLEYSNNPNADGSGSTGKTPDETVYVFTYQITNTKYKDGVKDENVLKGAEFKLYKNKECTDEVKLVLKNGTYYPASASENGVTMVSGDDGKFNIKGLDAGTYYLKETKAPDGYNTCDTIVININASHKEDAAKVGQVDLTGSQNMGNAIVDKSGTTLPSTGGMGTTVFYVVGGGLMAVAVVLLVTKKRMENKR